MKMVSPSESEIREVCILFLESHILQFMHSISMTFEADLYVTFCQPPAPPPTYIPHPWRGPSVALSCQRTKQMKGGNCALKVADADVNGSTLCRHVTLKQKHFLKIFFIYIYFKFKVTKGLAQHKQV